MPYTPPSAGVTWTAAMVADLASYGVAIRAVRTSNLNRNTTATPAADSELVIVLPANRTYDVTATLYVSSATNAAGDFRVSYSWTNTATVTQGGSGLVNTLASGSSADAQTAATAADATSPTTDLLYGASTTPVEIRHELTVVTGGSNVTLSLQWAQEVSNANNTSVLTGSKLVARRSA